MLVGGLAHAGNINFQVLGNVASFQVQGSALQLVRGTALVDLASGEIIPGSQTISGSSVVRDWSISGSFDLTPILTMGETDIARLYSLLGESTTAGLSDLMGGTPLSLLPRLQGQAMDRMTAGGAYTFGIYDLGATAACGTNLNPRIPGCEASELTIAFDSTSTFDPSATPEQLFPYLNTFSFTLSTTWVTPVDSATAMLHIDTLGQAETPEPGSIGLCAVGALGLAALQFRRLRAQRLHAIARRSYSAPLRASA
jgi:hypothetical protein